MTSKWGQLLWRVYQDEIFQIELLFKFTLLHSQNEDSVVNFICTWKAKVEFSKNGLKRSQDENNPCFKPFTTCWPTMDWKSLLKIGVAY